MTAVAEGYPTARSAPQLARKKGVETPIIDEVHAMLYEGKIIAQGTPEEIQRSGDPVVRQFIIGDTQGPILEAAET